MARIRTLKPEFWQDEKLAPLPPIDRLVFLGLISMADDCGRLLDNIKVIDAFIFPETSETCRGSVGELSRRGRIERGLTESGQRVIQIVNWDRHQRIEKANRRAALPQIVATSEDTDIPGSVGETSGKIPGGVADESPKHTYDLRPTTYDRRPSTSGGNGFDVWLARVPDSYREDIRAALRAANNPDALERKFVAMEQPITGGPAYGPEVVGQAVHEMAVGGVHMSAKALAAFCRRVGEPERPTATAELDQWSPEALARVGEAA